MTQRPEVVDDFVRNFLVRMNMDKTLECFQTEWYIYMLYFKTVFCEEKYSTVKKYHNKAAWCLLSTGFFYVQEGEGAIMCNLSLGDNAYRQMIEKYKVFKIKIFVSIYLRMTESEGNLCSQ